MWRRGSREKMLRLMVMDSLGRAYQLRGIRQESCQPYGVGANNVPLSLSNIWTGDRILEMVSWPNGACRLHRLSKRLFNLDSRRAYIFG